MSEINKLPNEAPNDVALEAGKKVIAAAVDLAVHTIGDSIDPDVRASLENEFRDKLIESGVPFSLPLTAEEPSDHHPVEERRGPSGYTRDEILVMVKARHGKSVIRPYRIR